MCELHPHTRTHCHNPHPPLPQNYLDFHRQTSITHHISAHTPPLTKQKSHELLGISCLHMNLIYKYSVLASLLASSALKKAKLHVTISISYNCFGFEYLLNMFIPTINQQCLVITTVVILQIRTNLTQPFQHTGWRCLKIMENSEIIQPKAFRCLKDELHLSSMQSAYRIPSNTTALQKFKLYSKHMKPSLECMSDKNILMLDISLLK